MKLIHAALGHRIIPVALTVSDADLAVIREQEGVELTADQIHVREMVMANDQPSVDRRLRVKATALVKLAAMYPGQPVMRNHNTWGSEDLPVGRVLSAATRVRDGITELTSRFYLCRDAESDVIVKKIDTRVYREVSISAYFRSFTCSVCGQDVDDYCEHAPGKVYDEHLCTVDLDDPDEPDGVDEVSIAWKGRLKGTSVFAAGQKNAREAPEALAVLAARAPRDWWSGLKAGAPVETFWA